jgi:homoserine acetyltransferase
VLYRETCLGSNSSKSPEELVANFKLTEGFAGRINDTLNFTPGALKDYHVIVVGMLGGGESSSPSNDVSFPNGDSLRYEDCIKSQYILVTEHLGLKSLDLVAGHSMGGQQAYYWAVMHGSGPDPFVKNVVPICSSAKTSGMYQGSNFLPVRECLKSLSS